MSSGVVAGEGRESWLQWPIRRVEASIVIVFVFVVVVVVVVGAGEWLCLFWVRGFAVAFGRV